MKKGKGRVKAQLFEREVREIGSQMCHVCDPKFKKSRIIIFNIFQYYIYIYII